MKSLKTGDRVAIKRDNKRGKWLYGEIEKLDSQDGSFAYVRWYPTPAARRAKRKGRLERICMHAVYKPRVLVFVPSTELPWEVRAWCEENRTAAVRCGSGLDIFKFVTAKAPHDSVYLASTTVEHAELNFHLAQPSHMQWGHDKFGHAAGDTDCRTDCRGLTWPEDLEAEF